MQIEYFKYNLYIKPLSTTKTHVKIVVNGIPNVSDLVPVRLVNFVIKNSAVKMIGNLEWFCSKKDEFPLRVTERIVNEEDYYKEFREYFKEFES